MSVRQEQEFKIDVAQLDPLAGAFGCVEQNPSLGRFQQITVRLEKATAESFVSHGRGPGCRDISIELCLCILSKAGDRELHRTGKFSAFLNVTARSLSQFLHVDFAVSSVCFPVKLCDLGRPLFPMRSRFGLWLAVPALFVALALEPRPIQAKSDVDQICVSVGRLLEEGHYTRHPLNDEMSKKVLQTYLELLDFSHLFFTQQDVDAVNAKYGTALDDDVLLGNLKPAYEIYDLYQKRVDERVAKVKELLKQPMDFKGGDSVELIRQKAPWPKNEAEADELWRGRIARELLQDKLSEHPIEPGPQLVGRRYDRIARNVHEEDREEQVKIYLDALAQSYDPHSEYLSKADFKNFNIQMGLSLVGIAAMLRTEDGYAKIESLVPGGPAQTADRLKVGDRITAVGQSQGEFVDVRDMRLDKVVEMIRGKKGTKVRLLAIPATAPDPSQRKKVELVRDEIKLKDQERRADIIIKKDENGNAVKLGWLTLPPFYADLDLHSKSTTRDVL